MKITEDYIAMENFSLFEIIDRSWIELIWLENAIVSAVTESDSKLYVYEWVGEMGRRRRAMHNLLN